jgi:hypothetical protein
MFLIVVFYKGSPRKIKGKHTKDFLRQLSHLLLRPVAFRPLLTEGLALSG